MFQCSYEVITVSFVLLWGFIYVFTLLGRALPNILFGVVMWSFSLVEYVSVTSSNLEAKSLVYTLCYFKQNEM